MERDHIVEAFRAVSAIEIYIKPKVPSTVNLFVRAPCSRCYVVKDLGDPTPTVPCQGTRGVIVCIFCTLWFEGPLFFIGGFKVC